MTVTDINLMMAQKDTNPYRFSDSNKRYQTYEYRSRQKFGKKVAKIPLDAGFSCPNIDKTGLGCIYCSLRGSGDFIPPGMTLREQYDAGRLALSSKWDTSACIAYLQAHTNTYAPAERLEAVYREVLSFPGVVGLNIATRADCLPDETCLLLDRLSRETALTVELGLQTTKDETAALIRRGHGFEEFKEGYSRLRRLCPGAEISVHIIFGLPGETAEDMEKTVKDLAALAPDEVKIHLLYVLKGTPMEKMLSEGRYTPMTREEYVDAVCRALTLLPEKTVIGRLTGDAPGDLLAAPEWSRKKTAVLNMIDRKMFEKGWYQGCFADRPQG